MSKESTKRNWRMTLMGLLGVTTLVIPVVILGTGGGLGDALAVVLVWPVIFYTLLLSTLVGSPHRGLWRFIGGALCLLYIGVFWSITPQFSWSFAIACFGVLFAFVVDMLSPSVVDRPVSDQ